jgi:hypothetical protein
MQKRGAFVPIGLGRRRAGLAKKVHRDSASACPRAKSHERRSLLGVRILAARALRALGLRDVRNISPTFAKKAYRFGIEREVDGLSPKDFGPYHGPF